MASKIKWPEWVWHEDEITNAHGLLYYINPRFGAMPNTQRAVVFPCLRAAIGVIRERPVWGGYSIIEAWNDLPCIADRRSAWRLAMEMLGYTEVCDA